jgi:hypothetical protein
MIISLAGIALELSWAGDSVGVVNFNPNEAILGAGGDFELPNPFSDR